MAWNAGRRRAYGRVDEDGDDDDDDDDEDGSGTEESGSDSGEGPPSEGDHDHGDGDESSSHFSFESSKAPVADFNELVVLLRALPDRAKLVDTCRALYTWSELCHNDRMRSAERSGLDWAAVCQTAHIDGNQLAVDVREALMFLLAHKHDGTNDALLGALSNLLYFTDVMWSAEEVRLDSLEEGTPYNAADPVAFPALWPELYEHREALHAALCAKLSDIVGGSVSSFVAAQVVAIDRMRDCWTHLMLNWLMSHNGDSARLNRYDPFLGFPLPCPGLPGAAGAVFIDVETLVVAQPTPELQRSALIFMEAFLHLLERDVVYWEYPVVGHVLLENPKRALRAILMRALEADDRVDGTTRLFVLRAVAVCPRIMFAEVGDGDDNAPHNNDDGLAGAGMAPLPLFTRQLTLASNKDQPFAVYQTFAAVMLLLVCEPADAHMEMLTWRPAEVCEFVSAAMQSVTAMRMLISGSSTVVSECAPVILCVGYLLDSVTRLLQNETELEDYLNYFEREAVPAAMQALRDLSAYPNATGYLQPTLAQLCAFTLPPAALYEGPNALAESNPAVALHALMARAVRSSLTATYLTVLDEYWNDLEDNPEHNGYFEEGLVLLEQVARNVVCNREFAAHLRHPHAVKLCERWLQQGVMNRFVNGGPLDTEELRERDFQYTLHQFHVRLVKEFCKAFDSALNLVFPQVDRGDPLEMMPLYPKYFARMQTLWISLASEGIVAWYDTPLLLEREAAEVANPRCTADEWHRLKNLSKLETEAFLSVVDLTQHFSSPCKPELVAALARMEEAQRWSDAQLAWLADGATAAASPLCTPDGFARFYRQLRRAVAVVMAVHRMFLQDQLELDAHDDVMMGGFRGLASHFRLCAAFFSLIDVAHKVTALPPALRKVMTRCVWTMWDYSAFLFLITGSCVASHQSLLQPTATLLELIVRSVLAIGGQLDVDTSENSAVNTAIVAGASALNALENGVAVNTAPLAGEAVRLARQAHNTGQYELPPAALEAIDELAERYARREATTLETAIGLVNSLFDARK